LGLQQAIRFRGTNHSFCPANRAARCQQTVTSGQQNNQLPSPQNTQRQGTTGPANIPTGQQGMNGGKVRPRRQPQVAGAIPGPISFAQPAALRDLIPRPLWTKLNWSALALLYFEIARSRRQSSIECSRRPDYVLGPGDELVIDYWGTSSQHLQRSVDREGRVSIPEAGSVVVAGRTLVKSSRLSRKCSAISCAEFPLT